MTRVAVAVLPTPGRIVTFHFADGETRPAIVANVRRSGRCDLVVFVAGPVAVESFLGIPHVSALEGVGASWSWPVFA